MNIGMKKVELDSSRIGSSQMVEVNAKPVRKARRPALWQQIVDALIDEIVSGQLSAGEVIPFEAAICEDFGVSRSVVRDALKVCQEKGIITIRAGIGSVVQDSSAWSVLDPALMAARMQISQGRDRVFDEVIGVRIALESEMARAAAGEVTLKQSEELARQIDFMSTILDNAPAYLEEDIQFHDRVLAISGNGIARAIMNLMADALHEQRKITNEIPGGVAHAHADHVLVFQAIAAGDGDAAAATMRAHLMWAWGKLREGRK